MPKGSCLCGGVAFEIDGRLTPIQLCHARRCQKFTGSAFSPELAAKASRFRWLRGEDLITRYEAPLLHEPPPLRRAFCRTCGSPLPIMLEGSDYIIMLAGVLDGDPGVRAFRHIFVDERAPWDEISDDLPQHGLRPGRNELLPSRPATESDRDHEGE